MTDLDATLLGAAERAATDAARAAADIIRRYYGQGVDVETKSDRSQVTVADREAEQAIRDILLGAFPDHGFVGEEFGEVDAQRDEVWLVDPLDGTKSFVRGYPFVSTQIALVSRGRRVLGVSSAPMFDELASAHALGPATLNGQDVSVSDVTSVADATLSIGNVSTLGASPAWSALGALAGEVHRLRGYGDFYHYHLLAAGKIDAVLESDVNILDIAALTVIVERAGGRFTDLRGGPVTRDTTTVLATNGHLHDALLSRLSAF
ncbi:MAG: inositol monophosphatase family protein [Pseudomonadota bacterium]